MKAPSSDPDSLLVFEVDSFRALAKRNGYPQTLAESMVTAEMMVYAVKLDGKTLYMEVSAPGFGIPGIIGITCLALVFLNQYLVGLADYTELLLLILGVLLLGFELLVIPGFGIAGIAGLVFIAAGAILAFQDFVIPDPSLPWQAEILTRFSILKIVVSIDSLLGI